jgi:hypothetical protein
MTLLFRAAVIFLKQPELIGHSSEDATVRTPKSFLINGRANMVESPFFTNNASDSDCRANRLEESIDCDQKVIEENKYG